ncbi:MAG: tRNA (adenosine(37)-N6)-threonylcarbamoyltransferase complex transferase subunit TsaD [Candidatus Micrarchaeota archaeon]
MKVLGIESTAHTLGVSVVESKALKKTKPSPGNTRVLSNVIEKYPSTAEGYVPRKLADHHAKLLGPTLEKALAEAKTKAAELDAVAYSYGPGIGHCLHAGYVGAKALSEFLGVPLVPVNHAVAHVEVARFFTGARAPLVVYVSGGNSQVFALEDKRYRVFGETLDIGVGNLLDNAGRILALEPPDAVGVLKLASEGKKLSSLPYTVKGMSFAFSGMLTSLKKTRPRTRQEKADACFSVQETAFSMLVEATERCLCHTRNHEVLLCGGNARNKRLQQMLALMASEQGARFCVAADEYNGDNAAMIALTGLQMLRADAVPVTSLPQQRIRIDSQRIEW